MRIWQIDPANLTPYYNRSLCEALATEGHQVEHFTSKFLYDPALTYPENFATHFEYFRLVENRVFLRFPGLRKGLRAVEYPFAHWRILRKLQRHKPDVVHFQWSRLPVFDQWLVSRIRQQGIPTVHTIHDVDPLFFQGRFTGYLNDVYKQINAFVVHTEDSRKRFLQSFTDIDPASIHIIPLIATEDRYLPGHFSRELARQLLNIPSDASVILFFGGIRHYKGVDVLADAIPAVHATCPDLQFWIVGQPDSEKDIRMLDGLRHVKNVHVHPQFVSSDQVWQYHLAADVVIFPYRNIFQSAALISAMGYGCAVIVTDVGGLPEAVDGNGWIIPPEDPIALADTIKIAIADPERLARMQQRSRALIAERHAPSLVARQHAELYSQLVEHS